MREYLFVLVVAAATTLLLIGPVGALASRWGAVPPTRDRDVHKFPIPRLGGVAMLGGFVDGDSYSLRSNILNLRSLANDRSCVKFIEFG